MQVLLQLHLPMLVGHTADQHCTVTCAVNKTECRPGAGNCCGLWSLHSQVHAQDLCINAASDTGLEDSGALQLHDQHIWIFALQTHTFSTLLLLLCCSAPGKSRESRVCCRGGRANTTLPSVRASGPAETSCVAIARSVKRSQSNLWQHNFAHLQIDNHPDAAFRPKFRVTAIISLEGFRTI